MNLRHALLTALLLIVAPAASAQVGTLPEHSPFEDVAYRQQFALETGWFFARRDPVGVAPRGGPYTGVRYDIIVAGPTTFHARLGAAASERTVIDPGTLDTVGTPSVTLAMADLGFTLHLTGQRAWRGLMPLVSGGIGVVSDLATKPDTGGYRFGTTFAFAVGGGVRWVPWDRWQVRADLTDRLYQIRYPTRYYTPPVEGDALLDLQRPRSYWRHNAALTVGLSYQFWR